MDGHECVMYERYGFLKQHIRINLKGPMSLDMRDLVFILLRTNTRSYYGDVMRNGHSILSQYVQDRRMLKGRAVYFKLVEPCPTCRGTLRRHRARDSLRRRGPLFSRTRLNLQPACL